MATGPAWRLDEYIICLDLYLKIGTHSEAHPQVAEVARLIRRTPASVALRLGNFQYVDPETDAPGLSGGARACGRLWELLAHDPELVEKLADLAKGRLPRPRD